MHSLNKDGLMRNFIDSDTLFVNKFEPQSILTLFNAPNNVNLFAILFRTTIDITRQPVRVVLGRGMNCSQAS